MAYIGKTPASAALTSSDISDGIIITDKLANDAVVTSKITDGTIATADIANDAITLAKMASGTDGNIISYDTSGNPVAVATGSSGQVLTSAGAGAIPSFQAAAGGGKLLQVVEGSTQTAASTTSGSYQATGLTVNITPSASNSKILVFATFNGGFVANNIDARYQLFRDTTSIGGGAANDRYISIGGGDMDSPNWFTYTFQQLNIQKLDSPSSTSQIAYNVKFNSSGAGNAVYFLRNRNGDTAGNAVIVAMEIGA